MGRPKYVKCQKCGWIHFIEPSVVAPWRCFNCGNDKRKTFVNALKKEIPEGSTIQPINRLITSRSWPVKVSRGGLVTIPKELRVKHDIQAGDDIDLIIFNGWISLIPTKNRPRAYKKLLALATKALEDNNRATHWLHRQQGGLGGKRPIDHMRTKKGAKEVEDLLVAIECGNYA